MINSEKQFERMIEGLLDEIGGYPSAMLKHELHSQKQPPHPFRTKKNLKRLQDSVDNLRICVKYLMFDLDATRRENMYYKKLLEDKEF